MKGEQAHSTLRATRSVCMYQTHRLDLRVDVHDDIDLVVWAVERFQERESQLDGRSLESPHGLERASLRSP